MASERDHNRAQALCRCRERGIVIPTFAQMRDPASMPQEVAARLLHVDMQTTDPLNLFRITWKNDVQTGGFGAVNALALPPALTGVPARIVGLVGRHFPTGAHKVGAAFGCLVPHLVTGGFDPTRHRAVWPSTGNYCRGGVFDCALLGCQAVAILPEGMSHERFAWLRSLGAEIIATPGCESNVKEIFDACWRLRASAPDAVIFNQFEELGNYLWHFAVTGAAAEEAVSDLLQRGARLAGWVSATGSAGTLAAGDYLKQRHPGSFIAASEALQCPTLLRTGFGAHRIEGIGDKHVPWIHNARNTDAVVAIDDEAAMRVFRLFNDDAGRETLVRRGVAIETVDRLGLMGISSVCNALSAIKLAKYFELDDRDVVLTVFTDSAEMYRSRLSELTAERGKYASSQAEIDFERRVLGAATDSMRELTYPERKALHNLKYFTWVEQQGKTVAELDALWSPAFWQEVAARLPEWDAAIATFNAESGALDTVRSRIGFEK
ncbi:MAG: pyridoxal-phosphate dependent enzyme [Candidatus Schekmanbacteria bacterium]|nr:pyridoxal-phosphate dependent enzyme [Candidatus Schekmanbacteria bacterium]